MPALSSGDLRLLAVLVVALLGAYGAWRNRPTAGSATLTAFMLGVATVVGAHLGAHLGPSGLQHLLVKARWSGLVALPYFLLAFSLAYTGREDLLSRRGVAAVVAVPAVTAGFLFAPDVTGLVGREVGAEAVATFLEEDGLPFTLTLVTAYVALFLATLLLLLYSFQVARHFRDVVWVTIAGIAVLWTGSVIEVLGLFPNVHVHWVQDGFLLMGLAILWAVYRRGLTDLRPIGRAIVMDAIDVAVVVVDGENRVTDVNAAALELLDSSERAVVGDGLDAVLADRDALREAIASGGGEEVHVTTDGGEHVVLPRVTQVTDRGGDTVGRTVLLYDVTTQHEQRRELERQNERLDEFASIVSHDLRNPLNVAQGRLALVKEDCDSEHIEPVADAHERMGTIIDRVLTFARTGDLVEEPEEIDLGTVARRSWRSVETPEASLSVETDRTILADDSYLQQLFENLFRNAVEHGGESVAVTVGSLDGGFYVADDGPGIPEDEREAVFASGHSTGDGGPGLGLAIVQDIVEAHGWEIRAAASETGGARFEITDVEVP